MKTFGGKPIGSQSGMTMIEIMVVVALIAGVVTLGIARINNTGRDMKQAVRRFSILGKDLHNRAKLFRKTYRIVLQIDQEKGHSYWVESSTGNVTLISEETEKELQKLTALQREGLVKEHGFTLEPLITKKPIELPAPLKFKSVEFSSRTTPLTAGRIYIHFFPQGLVEEAAIHITDGETLNWTVAFHPVTGKTDILPKEVPLKDLRGHEE